MCLYIGLRDLRCFPAVRLWTRRTPKKAKISPKAPVSATAAAAIKLNFVVNFAQTGNRLGVVINKILANRQAKKGTQENIREREEESKSCLYKKKRNEVHE